VGTVLSGLWKNKRRLGCKLLKLGPISEESGVGVRLEKKKVKPGWVRAVVHASGNLTIDDVGKVRTIFTREGGLPAEGGKTISGSRHGQRCMGTNRSCAGSQPVTIRGRKEKEKESKTWKKTQGV